MKEFNKKNYVIIKSVISEETADVAKNYFALKAQILDTYQKINIFHLLIKIMDYLVPIKLIKVFVLMEILCLIV